METAWKSWQTAVRIMKGLVLVFFILILSKVTLEAYQGTFSKHLLNANGFLTLRYVYGLVPRPLRFFAATGSVTPSSDFPPATSCETPNAIFGHWLGRGGKHVVGLALDAVSPGWRSRPGGGDCKPSEWQGEWIATFQHVDETLERLIMDSSFDVATQNVKDLLLPDPTAVDAAFEGYLPPHVQKWFSGERAKRRLADTLVLLVVIGTLGSLIYLIVGFISPEDVPSMRDLVFRPILGAFLAVGVFVANVGVLGLTSTGGVAEVRNEALYLMALGAGLFTDRVYEYLRSRVVATLTGTRSEERVETHVTDVRHVATTRSSGPEVPVPDEVLETPGSVVPATPA